MYHHVLGAEKVTQGLFWRPHHHHLLIDTAAAVITAILLTDCAYEGGSSPNDSMTFAMNMTPYFDNCLEDDFGC